MTESRHISASSRVLVIGTIVGIVSNVAIAAPMLIRDGLWITFYLIPLGASFGWIGSMLASRIRTGIWPVIIGGAIGGIIGYGMCFLLFWLFYVVAYMTSGTPLF